MCYNQVMEKGSDIRIGLDAVQDAVATRAAITQRYKTYSILSKMVQVTALIEHSDFKSAVDALYYLGGGWPNPNSKGRMEKLLDNFAGMYRVLSFIDRGELVESHLLEKGIEVRLTNHIANATLSDADIKLLEEEYGLKDFGFKRPETLRDLVDQCVLEAQELQRFICQNADKIKYEFKPGAKQHLAVEDEEYDRLFFLTKYAKKPEQVIKKKKAINGSVDNFKSVAKNQL